MASRFDPRTTCLHLRCKEMFYAAPSHEPEHRVGGDSPASDTTAYWCAVTQTGRGPDAAPVGLAACSQPGRRCLCCAASIV